MTGCSRLRRFGIEQAFHTMKICLYNVTSCHIAGGLETCYWEMGRALARRGHDVTLYAKVGSRFSGRTVTPLEADGYAGERILAQYALRDHRVHPYQVFMDHSH